MKIIRPFAEWNIIRDARRRSSRVRYTISAATSDRKDIRAAIDFLNWLDEKQLDLAAAGQEDLDLWLTTHPTRRRSIGAFIRWASARRLTNKMALAAERTGLPSRFITETALNEQLKRCLNDDQLPLDVRIAGGLIGLYGLPVVRLVELTTDRFERTGDDAYLTIERNPVLLPPKLALLIEEQVARPTVRSMLRPPQDGRPTYLLPGVPAHRPITAQRIVNKLRKHGLEHQRPQHRHARSRGRPSSHRDQLPLRRQRKQRPQVGSVRPGQLDGLPRCLHERRSRSAGGILKGTAEWGWNTAFSLCRVLATS
ncbi:hypothetical protein AB0D78_46225 [Streptomyces avermitilis]|uniref:hypothetical protein n=2 Tax=Streptomyces avermitilis TaxID=33903 RepID=UPI0033DF581B